MSGRGSEVVLMSGDRTVDGRLGAVLLWTLIWVLNAYVLLTG
ncbi:hypothetical protein AB0G05_07775 [Nonomuraea wenchangensis]